ncbi:MAG: hypothetical protein U9Q30_07610, partial [Campylobacterota bacterium]|nr:hypothetical protein [Campylobacterota bacterium]
MKLKSKIISVVTASLLSTSLLATTLDIKEGWSMYGLTEGIEDLNSTFNNYPNDIRAIWTYDSISGKWKFYSPNNEVKKIIDNSGNNFVTLDTIAPKEGFWIDAYSDVQIETTNSIIILDEDNSTIIPDENNSTVIPDEDNSTIAILEEEYNVCKSTKFGLISNIEDSLIEEFDINNPFSYIDTGITISTSKDFNLFYNHEIYNNNIDDLDMYISIDNKYLAKVNFKQEFTDKLFVVVYNDNRYIGKFKETTL